MATRSAFVSLEQYKLVGVLVTNRVLGTGASATVIELEYMGLKCAGKKIHDDLLKVADAGSNDSPARQFSRECRILSRINHANVVQFLGVYFQREVDVPILVMEFLPTNLTACIEKHGCFPSEVKYSILRDIAQGLVYLHSQCPPIIHRDLSSNNILLSPVMTAKIADLGVAKIMKMSPLQMSKMTRSPGTHMYMPPEAMVADPLYNTSIDVFSYGILTIQIFCGQSPLPDVGPTHWSEEGELVAISEADRRRKFLDKMGTDHPLMSLILKCISNDPSLRPASIDIVNELTEQESQARPSFKQRLDTIRHIAVNEAEKGVAKRKEATKVGKKKVPTKSTAVQVPTQYIWIAGLFAFLSIFVAFQFGVHNERSKAMTRPTPSMTKVTKIDSNLQQVAHSFANTTYGECSTGKTIACDKVVPAILRNFGHISWTSVKPLETSVFQGHTVVIDDIVYYGGGIAEEKHENIVYCYNISSDVWTALKPLPIKSFGLGKLDDKLIALGGLTTSNKDEANTKVYTFDVSSGSWTTGVIPDMQMPRVFPEVLSLSSALVVAGGQSMQYYAHYNGYHWLKSMEVYTPDTGWYWSDQPLPESCTDLSLSISGSSCFVLGGNYTKAYIYSQWISHKQPLSLYVPVENILWDRNKTTPGMAYEYQEKVIFPTFRWKLLPGPGGRPNQANSLVATVFAGNLITFGTQGKKDTHLRMYSLTDQSWTEISQLPGVLEGPTVTALSLTELLVTGNMNSSGLLSVYRGTVSFNFV